MSLYNINRATILGNATKAPELKYTPGGTAVANFSVATNHSVKDGDDYKDIPTFHDIVVWGKAAEFISENLSKGQQVYVEGRLQKREWEHDGQKYRKTEIVAERVIPSKGGGSSKPVSEEPPANYDGGDEEVDPDDIPF